MCRCKRLCVSRDRISRGSYPLRVSGKAGLRRDAGRNRTCHIPGPFVSIKPATAHRPMGAR